MAAAAVAASGRTRRTIVVLFRNDLRLHDNAVLWTAVDEAMGLTGVEVSGLVLGKPGLREAETLVGCRLRPCPRGRGGGEGGGVEHQGHACRSHL